MIRTLWTRYFGTALRQIEEQSLAYRLSPAGQGFDRKTAIVLLVTALTLTFQNYGSTPARITPMAGFFVELVAGPESASAVVAQLQEWESSQIVHLTWWAIAAVITYALIPILVIKLIFRESLHEYGTKVHGIWKSWPVYSLFVAVMVPLVIIFSAEERFQGTYPFYRVNSAADLDVRRWIRWELLYAAQFVALEFFFRGFIVHGTKHRFGSYSLFVMTVPYCMIHFGKPMPEAMASIIAGVALGAVSLATRSIWLGAALHISVAWGMDAACLWRRGLFE